MGTNKQVVVQCVSRPLPAVADAMWALYPRIPSEKRLLDTMPLPVRLGCQVCTLEINVICDMPRGGAARPRVTAFIRRFATNSQAAHVETDQGEYVIKVLNNRDGPPILVADWIGSMAGQWLGVPVPDVAVIDLPVTVDIPLSEDGRAIAQAGPCFGSRFVASFGWEGDAETLKSLENPEAIPALVLLDTWLRNLDRFCRSDDGRVRFKNPGNLLLHTPAVSKGRFRMAAIDFGYAFGGPSKSRRQLASQASIRDDTIYGCFPAFRPYLRRESLQAGIQRLWSCSGIDAEAMLSGIPREWELDLGEAAVIADFIKQRSQYVAEKFERMIWEDDRLWGTEPAVES